MQTASATHMDARAVQQQHVATEGMRNKYKPMRSGFHPDQKMVLKYGKLKTVWRLMCPGNEHRLHSLAETYTQRCTPSNVHSLMHRDASAHRHAHAKCTGENMATYDTATLQFRITVFMVLYNDVAFGTGLLQTCRTTRGVPTPVNDREFV